ncbi:MAG TPA: hypothetical protein VGC67_17640 [Cellulomonas sp.]
MKNFSIEIYAQLHRHEVSAFVADRYHQVDHFAFTSHEQLRSEIAQEDRSLARTSTIALARHRNGSIVSTARLIERRDSTAILPVERVFGISVAPIRSEGGRVFEFARLASDPAGSRGLAWQLAATLNVYCQLDPVSDSVVAGVDARLLRAMQDRGWGFERIGEPLVHLGSATVPIRVDLAAADALLRRTCAPPVWHRAVRVSHDPQTLRRRTR